MGDPIEDRNIIEDARMTAEEKRDNCPQAPMALEGKHIYQTRDGAKICIYCDKPVPEAVDEKLNDCNQAPRALEGKHVYRKTGTSGKLRCIYCDLPKPKPEKDQDCKKSAFSMEITIPDLDKLVGALELNGFIEVSKTRVDGMKAANECCRCRDDSPEYTEDHFATEANNLESYARRLRLMRKSIK